MLIQRFLYTILLWLLLPYIFLRLIWRARKQPEYLHHIGERFGFYATRNEKPLIWLHAVSVGETRATQSLVSRLLEQYPGHRILLTHTTPTGRAASEQLYGERVLRVYLPYDYPFAVNQFLCHFNPKIGVLMETEIWANLIHACNKRRIPLLLLNARMSENSAQGYARFSSLTRHALSELAAVAAQTAEDAERLTRLGATDVSVMGNLKFDIVPPVSMLELGKHLGEQFGAERKIFLAASTREGEESLLLEAMNSINIPGLLTVIVPRHPQRFQEVADLIERLGLNFQRKSANKPVPNNVRVVLGDSMGELFAYYVAADLAFVGGSLLQFGGQNLIESCAVGTPVLVGPHTYNFSEATRLALSTGAAIQIKDVTELTEEVQRLLNDDSTLKRMRHQCAVFVEENRGATDRSVQIIAQLIDKP